MVVVSGVSELEGKKYTDIYPFDCRGGQYIGPKNPRQHGQDTVGEVCLSKYIAGGVTRAMVSGETSARYPKWTRMQPVKGPKDMRLEIALTRLLCMSLFSDCHGLGVDWLRVLES